MQPFDFLDVAEPVSRPPFVFPNIPDPKISEIEPGLYIGDLMSSYEADCLAENNITAKLSLQKGDSARWRYASNRKIVPAARHLLVPCAASSTQDLLVRMTEMCDFIEEMRGETNKHVLVHCTTGTCRAVAVVAAYLMRKHHLSPDSALALIKEKQNVNLKSNFMEQLVVWDETGYGMKLDMTSGPTKLKPPPSCHMLHTLTRGPRG